MTQEPPSTREHIDAIVETVAALEGWRIEQELPDDWVEPPHLMPMLIWHLTRVVRDADGAERLRRIVLRLPESVIRFRPENAWKAVEHVFARQRA